MNGLRRKREKIKKRELKKIIIEEERGRYKIIYFFIRFELLKR